MKKVLVTGAGGFIGRHTLPLLVERGLEVHATYLNKIPVGLEHYNWHRANLLESGNVEKLINSISPEYLLHLSWETTHGKFWSADVNYLWTKASLELVNHFIHNNGKRIVAAGTCAEYDLKNGEYLEEKRSPLTPESVYGQCKLSFYNELKTITAAKKVSYAWGRIFYLYGPNEKAERLIPFVIKSLLSGEETKTTHGNQLRDYLYVEDVADAFVQILDSELTGAVNVSSGVSVKLGDITTMIANKLGKENLLKTGAIQADLSEPESIVGSASRLMNELYWRPKYNLSAGLDKTILWWKEKMDLKSNYQNKFF
jgi:nucleoside-diphosphate-sugar epimerase